MNAPERALEIKAALTGVISAVTALLGQVGVAVVIMVICMALDWVTGSLAARAHGELNSTKARDGLWHKLGEVIALMVAALADLGVSVVLSTAAAPLIGDGFNFRGYIVLVVAVWYTFTELISILENVKKMGAPIPDWLIRGIGKLKGKVDKTDPMPGSKDNEEDDRK